MSSSNLKPIQRGNGKAYGQGVVLQCCLVNTPCYDRKKYGETRKDDWLKSYKTLLMTGQAIHAFVTHDEYPQYTPMAK